MKTSITFYPNKSKKSKRTGKVPLYAKAYFRGLKAEDSLNAEITETDLLKWDPMSMRFTDRQLSANKLLNMLDQKFQELIILSSTSLPQIQSRENSEFRSEKQKGKLRPCCLIM